MLPKSIRVRPIADYVTLLTTRSILRSELFCVPDFSLLNTMSKSTFISPASGWITKAELAIMI